MAIWRDLNTRATEIARIAAERAERGRSNLADADLGCSRKRSRDEEEKKEEGNQGAQAQGPEPPAKRCADQVAMERNERFSAAAVAASGAAMGSATGSETVSASIPVNNNNQNCNNSNNFGQGAAGLDQAPRNACAGSAEVPVAMMPGNFPAPVAEAPPPAPEQVAPEQQEAEQRAAAAAAAPAPAPAVFPAMTAAAAPLPAPSCPDRDRSSCSSKGTGLIVDATSAGTRPYVRRELPVRLEQLFTGCTKRIRLDNGSSSSPGSSENADANRETCAATTPGGKVLEFQILPGWGEGSVVVFQGTVKDLHVAIKEIPHERFVRCGDDLVHVVDAARCTRTPMGSLEALVTCIDGTTVRVRKDVEEYPDLPVVLRGYGMPRKMTTASKVDDSAVMGKKKHASALGARGDLIVRFTNICREIAEGTGVSASESFTSPPAFSLSAPSVVPQHEYQQQQQQQSMLPLPRSVPMCSQQINLESGSPRKSAVTIH